MAVMNGSIAVWLNSIPQYFNWKTTSIKKPVTKKNRPLIFSEITLALYQATDIRQALRDALAVLQKTMIGELNCQLYIVQRAAKASDFELLPCIESDAPYGLLDRLSDTLSAQTERVFTVRYKLTGSVQTVYVQKLNNPITPTQTWLVLCCKEALPSYGLVHELTRPMIEALEKGLGGWYLQQANIQQAVCSERAAHAAELHDSLAQVLGYMRMKSSRLASLCEAQAHPAIKEMSVDLATQANLAYRQARELISTSRLSLQPDQLIDAIIIAVEECQQRSAIVFEIENEIGARLTTKDDIQVLHIVREALCNIVRHSKASHASVTLLRQPDQTIKVCIEDNGTGIKSEQGRKDSFGLSIMKERASKLAANLSIAQRKHGGTRIELHLPGGST
jgi:nitrate/nitrite-specific signal transduction histidine kinase